LVDTNTLIVISTIVQTVVISVTLIVFILQFRSQERAIKESSYQGLMGRYNDLVAMLVDKPDLANTLLMSMPGGPPNAKKEDAVVYAHMLLAFGIMEEAYTLYSKKWIDEDNWRGWAAFLERLSHQPAFRQICEISAGTFDSGFEKYVADNILKKEAPKEQH
jgi:hypothetical protein